MAIGDYWHRTLVYFGLAEDEEWYDDDEDGTAAQEDLERTYRERPNVRRLDRSRGGRRGEPASDADDIFPDEAAPSRSGRRRHDAGAQTAVIRPAAARGEDLPKVYLSVPRSFNDAQPIADRMKRGVPVIINLQTADAALAKRLIDFASGLTYALDGGMQRIADKVFLLTPPDVELSAEDRARYVDGGFFNQA
jgi:cell division inhibitor SepF